MHGYSVHPPPFSFDEASVIVLFWFYFRLEKGWSLEKGFGKACKSGIIAGFLDTAGSQRVWSPHVSGV